ncbi:MAG: hypothetical protein US74_C0019G0007 [Parcubacteria group bacterium GW2011_GWA2_38_13]|nr:MAG: hypothetical protein US74_C0019G0007 [Parcubacteria group bacterium GW2011_GWA2_38_13]
MLNVSGQLSIVRKAPVSSNKFRADNYEDVIIQILSCPPICSLQLSFFKGQHTLHKPAQNGRRRETIFLGGVSMSEEVVLKDELVRKMARTGGNILGTRHRRKGGPDNDPRATQVVVLDQDGNVLSRIELETEDDELDFIRGRFPVAKKKIEETDNPSVYPFRHVSWKKLKKGADISDVNPLHIMKQGKEVLVATHVPVLYEGLMKGDTVAGILGGSGDRWNAACFRQGKKISAKVFRVPSFILSKNREIDDNDEDGYNTGKLFLSHPELFYEVNIYDREVIAVRELLDLRMRAMKNRIAIGQQIQQSLVGSIFTSEEDLYPEGTIEDACLQEIASDKIYEAIEEEEARRVKKLIQSVEGTKDLWERIFEPVEGWGPMQAAKIIATVGDIRRFATDASFRSYCELRPKTKDEKGNFVHPRLQFPRKRRGSVSKVSPIRQAIFLLVDQANRRPTSLWGRKLLENKAKLRERHPEPVMMPSADPKTGKDKIDSKTGKPVLVKCYTDGHIHKMGIWKTAEQICNHIYHEWWKIAREREARIKDGKILDMPELKDTKSEDLESDNDTKDEMTA